MHLLLFILLIHSNWGYDVLVRSNYVTEGTLPNREAARFDQFETVASTEDGPGTDPQSSVLSCLKA